MKDQEYVALMFAYMDLHSWETRTVKYEASPKFHLPKNIRLLWLFKIIFVVILMILDIHAVFLPALRTEIHVCNDKLLRSETGYPST